MSCRLIWYKLVRSAQLYRDLWTWKSYCIALHDIISNQTTRQTTTLYQIRRHNTTLHQIKRHDITRHYIKSDDTTKHDIISNQTTRHNMSLYQIESNDTTQHNTRHSDIRWYMKFDPKRATTATEIRTFYLSDCF